MAQAGITVDALRHLDAQRHVLPLVVAGAQRDALVAGAGHHRRWYPSSFTRLDPRVKIGWTVDVTNISADSLDALAPSDERQHTEHGLERKQQLLDAAAELFADRGYAATRVVDICAAAGVAKGLFYWYFPTKGALFAELVRTMRLRLRRAQGAVLDPTADAVTRIANGAEASVRFMADHAAYFALLDVERTDPDVADVLDEGAGVYLDDVRRLVEEGQRAGHIADAPSSLVAVGVLGTVSSFSNSYRNGRLGDDVTVDDLAAFVRRWVASALAGDAA
ncbi:MAG: TetR/AcrR family transcriptional regulator [Acidimicrobiales bacterium]|nr:MAG: TetR/AcrR family transcriptional regulator [Acidimicrobiales bacterium]